MNFLDRLKQNKTIISDAAFGPALAGHSITVHGIERELLNIRQPDVVRRIHRAHIDAGATIVLTNTFSANRYALGLADLEDSLESINAAGSKLARDAAAGAGREVFVFGRIGPLWLKRLEPLPMNEVERRAAYRDQLRALLKEPLDGLLIETMMDLTEARLAILSARELCDLPVAASIRYRLDTDGGISSPNGNPLSQCLHGLIHAGADIVGLNGTFSADRLVSAARSVISSCRAPVWARIAMTTSSRQGAPDELNTLDRAVRAAMELKTIGVRIIGGDAGSTGLMLGEIQKTFIEEGDV